MDQQDKNWLELGHRLENYQPEGDPASDFNVVQQLQQEAEKKKRSIFGIFFACLSIVGILLVLIWLSGSGAGSGRPGDAADQRTVLKSGAEEREPERKEDQLPSERNLLATTTEHHPTEISEFQPVTREAGSTSKKISKTNRRQPGELVVPSFLPVRGSEAMGETPAPPAAAAAENQPPTQPERLTARRLRAVVPLASDPFPSAVVRPEVPAQNARQVVLPPSSPVTFSLGAGLSNHWRGANFWQEVDRGVYAYLGLQRRFGNRLSLEGRIGYRGHTMQLPIIRDTDKPWSYHEEEVHSPDHTGTIQAYTYQGIVKGYRAVEFSLLANYSLGNRWQLSAGARYALPALEVHRTVRGPDDVNPFHDFIEGTSLVKYFDYGGLMGVNYRFNKHLQLETSLHLGMVDLINDAAEGMERFNHSSSISIGVKYLME